MIAFDHPVDAYAVSVARRELPAGKYHRLSCVRHLRDRVRAERGDPSFPYRFDPAKAERFFRFASNLRHYKGRWAGQPIVLRPYQVFRLGSLFGWVHVKTGLRRFRTSYNEIPRKNGKTLEAAIVALYVTFFDGENGAEGYCIATKRDQARICFNDCGQLVRSSHLKRRIVSLSMNLHQPSSASKLEPLGADKDSTDGLNPNLIINDEFHAQKDRGMLDVMETATGARDQPVNFQITTAGNDPMTPCGDQHDYAVKILERVLVDDTFFAFIAHADAVDDWTLEATWRKANPNYGVSVQPDDLRSLATKAIHMASAAPAFKQKHLNLWVNTDAPWLSLEGWRHGQTSWTAEDMSRQRGFIGIDLSSKIDLTAVVVLFPPTETRATWRLLSWALTPADTLAARAQRDRAPYAQWVEAGWLTTCPGNRIDQNAVLERVAWACSKFDVQAIGLDPWNAGNLVTELEKDKSRHVAEIPQTLAQMSGPCKEFEADVLDGMVDGQGNPLLLWAASNVIAPGDDKGNLYPSKRRSRGRIDPIVAALIARKVSTIEFEPVEKPKAFQMFTFGGATA